MKVLGKTEIARMFGLSRPWFMRRFHLEFTEIELKDLKYEKSQKVFYSNQIEAIFLKMGNPTKNSVND